MMAQGNILRINESIFGLCVLTFCITLLFLGRTTAARHSASDIPRGSLSAGKCRLLINEINFFPAGTLQFIELKRSCNVLPAKLVKTSMKNFRLVFFTHDAQLIGICQPGLNPETEFATQKQGSLLFFTIGGEAIENKDMNIQDCSFASDNEDHVTGRLPAGNHPIAIGLIHNVDSKIISGVQLDLDPTTQKPIKTHIRYSMEQVIMRNLQDLYIVVSSSPYTGCKYFERYYTGYTIGSNNFLRDWGYHNDNAEQSLNRCKVTTLDAAATDWVPFEAQHFYLAKSSPGKNNQCQGGVRFVIEDSQPKRKKPRVDFSEAYSCQVTTEDMAIENYDWISNPITYQRLLTQAYENAEAELFTESYPEAATVALLRDSIDLYYPQQSEGQLYPSISDSTNIQEQAPSPFNSPTVKIITSSIEKSSIQSSVPLDNATPVSTCKAPQPTTNQDFENYLHRESPFMWEDCNRFEHKELLNDIQAEPQNAPIKEEYIKDPKVCRWLDWLPSTKAFRCKWCNKLWNQKIVFDNSVHITKIIRDGQGYSKGTHAKYDNKRMLENHMNSDIHKLTEEYLRLYDSGKRGKDLKKSFEEQDGPYRKFLNKTENRFVSVFQAIKLDLPFLKYPLLSELLHHYGVDMGTLYNTQAGMKLISVAISDKMHKDLCAFLKTSKPEMSILVDTSSDVSSTYSLAIIFQTFDERRNAGTIFYRLIHVSTRETTENLYQLIIEALNEDGLLEYVKEKMVGFGTDGGANVRKLKDLLNEITLHDIIYVYCHAHRLERAVKHAWDGEKILTDVDSLVNSLFTTFNSRSPKKKLVMQQKIKELEDSRFELKPIKKIRWVNSKKRATETVVRHWRTITMALQAIQIDKTFPSKQKASAKVLEERLRDPSVISTLAFVADASQELAKISLNLQKYGSTLIGKKGTREEIKQGLRSLENLSGPNMKWLLSTAQVRGSKTTGIKLIDFDTQVIELEGIQLKPSSLSRIGDVLSEYIDSLIREIDISFPEDVTDSFDIFNVKAWPKDGSLDEFGNSDLLELNSELKWNYPRDSLLENWASLKKNITESEDLQDFIEKTPEVLWSTYLQRTNMWTPDLHQVVTKILVIPASTAEVERIYSHYTSTKTMRRYSLDVSSVEAIIRIKVNGDKTVEDFSKNAHQFVKQFILSGHLRSDDRNDKGSVADSSQCVPPEVNNNRQLSELVDNSDEESDNLYTDSSSMELSSEIAEDIGI